MFVSQSRPVVKVGNKITVKAMKKVISITSDIPLESAKDQEGAMSVKKSPKFYRT